MQNNISRRCTGQVKRRWTAGVTPSSINLTVKNVAALSRRNIESQLHSRMLRSSLVAPTIHAVRNIYCRVVRSYNGTSNLPGKLARKLPRCVLAGAVRLRRPSLSYLLLRDFIEIRYGVKLALRHGKARPVLNRSFLSASPFASTCSPLVDGTDAFAWLKP